ncbi:MAG: hypothetical protein ABGW77_06485 [Campylobacterales bacterium]
MKPFILKRGILILIGLYSIGEGGEGERNRIKTLQLKLKEVESLCQQRKLTPKECKKIRRTLLRPYLFQFNPISPGVVKENGKKE